MTRLAFITGINGQDGSYLSEFLLDAGYHVYGMVRRASTDNSERISTLANNPNFDIMYGDLTDSGSLDRIFKIIIKENPGLLQEQPGVTWKERNCTLEVYNLAAQSHVGVSFEMPEYTGEVDALGVTRLLESIRQNGLVSVTRFYQASTSELFGLVQETPQRETTPFYPRSPYAVAKLYGYWIVKNYREAYNMFACTGILFNHESSRRGIEFVTRKITTGIANILVNKQDHIELGNIYSKRDWFHAQDAVVAMWLMLQHDTPMDFVISSNETHSVKEFIDKCMQHLGIDIYWRGEGIDEEGYDEHGKVWFKINPKFFRPSEVDLLHGCSDLARSVLGWQPKYDFTALVKEMMDHDLVAAGIHYKDE